ncbi:MAG: hypothetical protein QM516_01310 [Limnohabitans sp.]|nr:hypothetical protein [Limnohabitans sp.]
MHRTQPRLTPSPVRSLAATLTGRVSATLTTTLATTLATTLTTTLTTTLVATTATAQVVVTDVPQIGSSSQYNQCKLSANGDYAAMTTNELYPRLVRWTASTNTLFALTVPPANPDPYATHVTDIGSVTGNSIGSSVGTIWYSNGTTASNPFPSSNLGITPCPSQNGVPFFITDLSQSALYEWSVLGAPFSHGKPVGSSTIRPLDANPAGTACAVTAQLAGNVNRSYRWTASGGFQLLPLLDGMTDGLPAAISDDGTRVIGVNYKLGSVLERQGYFWSASTGIISMGLPSNALIEIHGANGDCSLVCGTYSSPGVWQPFVWSLYGGLTTARDFAISRGYDPGPFAFEIFGFSSNARTALAQRAPVTKLLQNLGKPACGSAGSCFAAKTSPGCADTTCCERVCGADPYCCDGMWDAQCVVEAEALCRTGATCADPVRITSYVASSYDYNTGYDATASDESSCGVSDLKAVWRVYRAPCGGAVTIDTCTEFAEGPIVLSVYSSCGTEIACSAGAYLPCGSTRAAVGFDSVANTDYLIRIASSGGSAAGSIAIACETSCGAPTSGACNIVHAGVGCNDASCCATVCANDPYCCDSTWDAQCVGEAQNWCFTPGDFDFDGDIDAADLAELLAGWGLGGATDIDGDGLTGASDLSMLLGSWG